MEKNNSTYYDPEKKRSPWLRIVILGVGLIIVFVIILLITKGCSNKKNMEKDMITASQKYYKDNDNLVPKSIGQCDSVTLEELQQNNKINLSKYKKCNFQKTLVKACMISEKEYQYVPIFDCENNKTEFNNWNVGKVDDLKRNSSDVSFKFLGEIQKNGVKNYYPDNLTNDTKVSQYYITIPQEEYTYKDNSSVAYKWYVAKNKKEYYNNGTYSASAPDGYPESEAKKANSYITLTKPTGNVKSTSMTVYANEVVSHPFWYKCFNPNSNKVETIVSDALCENRGDKYNKTYEIHYTCNGTDEVAEGTICQQRSKWSETSCKDKIQTMSGTTNDGYNFTRQITTGFTCISTSGYLVTQDMWKWYKNVSVNCYVPNDKENADEENTYYVNVPVAGAIKDENTKATAYKYYKIMEGSNSNSKIWVGISDDYMTESDLISKFKELGYDVNSLEDINNNSEIKYQIELSFRDRK